MRLQRFARLTDDRGSISAWIALAAVVLIVCVGLAVDLGGQVQIERRARAIAAQAARAGGQEISDATVRGDPVTLAVAAARSAATSALASAGLPGTVTVRDGITVSVSVTDTYDPVFLGIIGIGDLPVTGTATARAIRTMGDTER